MGKYTHVYIYRYTLEVKPTIKILATPILDAYNSLL